MVVSSANRQGSAGRAAASILRPDELFVRPGSGATALSDPALTKVNPMSQLPALILPSGELMTESSAILIWLADDHPEARFSVEHITQYAEQRTRLYYRGRNAISDKFPDYLRLTGDRGD